MVKLLVFHVKPSYLSRRGFELGKVRTVNSMSETPDAPDGSGGLRRAVRPFNRDLLCPFLYISIL